MLVDLHTHTTASDGTLSPAALVARAQTQGVTHLSITDHDTVSAYAGLPDTAAPVLIPGIELSSRWRNIGVHVVGLNIDLAHPALVGGIEAQQRARQRRAETIASRLIKAGLDDPLPAVAALAGAGGIGRPHFARHLVDTGKVRNHREAFRKYLGRGKAGDVRQVWATLDAVIGWIVAAGGVAVLAHPAHYRLTWMRLAALAADFREAGGRAIEVVSGRQEAALTRRLSDLARDHALLASCGSDFHGPGKAWSEVGGVTPLPPACRPVWDAWQ